uniref:CUB_2 domain-containing protein n=2 Tax=Caenorhabditis tropicalis TaxID=1561998 RepID=A0A1I7UTT3_9PELO
MDTLRLNHVYVSVVTSTTPSGGLYQQTMYDIATRTNGICVFESDDWIHWTSPYITQLDTPYTIYSLNVGVAGSGNFSLPPIKSPCTTLFCDYFLLMTIQDHGPLDSFQTAKLTWQNIPNNSSDSLDNNTTYLKLSNGSLFVTTAMSLDANMSYSMNLDYDYSDTRYQILQIRVLDVV